MASAGGIGSVPENPNMKLIHCSVVAAVKSGVEYHRASDARRNGRRARPLQPPRPARLKSARHLATRYEQTVAFYAAFVALACSLSSGSGDFEDVP